nr:helix-turn-helix transcriptional regulator [uncultured Oscillibacter sp.]
MRKTTIEGNMTPIDRKLVEAGMTRATLARLSKVPLRTLENWSKRTIKSPNVYQFYRVAQVLGCSVEDLLEPDMVEAVAVTQRDATGAAAQEK